MASAIIVAGANVPKGSFYNHFDSKEAFGAEVVDAYFESVLGAMRAILCDEQTPPVERLRRYSEGRMSRMSAGGYVRGCLLGNLTLETADHSDLIRTRLASHFATWSALMKDCVDQAQREGSITTTLPAATVADFLLDSWEGALLRARAEKSDEPLRRFIDVIFASILS
ncbi:MAG: TetR family transcriptional regulator C-terminal domain-containing protein [Gordonia sp. (in: high G+C Gram-positive bacteria)]